MQQSQYIRKDGPASRKGEEPMKRNKYLPLVVAFALCVAAAAVAGSENSGEIASPDGPEQLSCAPCAAALTPKERQLYDLVMAYRASLSLPSIPLSSSLSYVAKIHVRDLEKHSSEVHGLCNMHSWSKDGTWTACCYTSDHAQAKCMWYKPRELTPYTGYGFEISVGGVSEITPEQALHSWKSSSGHNAVIINGGSWRARQWRAVGIGIYKKYAVIWFGGEDDPCNNSDGKATTSSDMK